MKRSVLAIFLSVVAAAAVRAENEPRTALVMGVWEYSDPNFPALPGIADDVKNMSAKLRELGFAVTTVTNPTLGQAKEAVDAFSAALKTRKGVGCFYFSGHGCEHEGRNYLIPKGTNIARRADVDDEALSAQRVLNGMEDAGTNVNLVFLDCCRNTLSKGASGGLAAMQASGTFIGFATASTQEANAAQGGSIYTQALLKYLGTPGISITDMHTRVTHEVKLLTTEAGSPQIPFQYSGLDDVFCLVPGNAPPPGPTMQPAAPAAVPEPVALPERGYFSLAEVFQDTSYARYNSFSREHILSLIQERLKTTGDYSGEADGSMGPRTQTAIIAWRDHSGTGRGGRIDVPMLEKFGLANVKELSPPPAPPKTPKTAGTTHSAAASPPTPAPVPEGWGSLVPSVEAAPAYTPPPAPYEEKHSIPFFWRFAPH